MFWDRREKVIHWEEIRKDYKKLTAKEPKEDFEKRVLCEDESCIGVVGKDGRCRVCGRVRSKRGGKKEAIVEEEVAQADVAPESEEEVEEEEEEERLEAKEEAEERREAEEEEDEEEEEEVAGQDLSDRVLCSDGSCIGLVGKDGYCRACGLKWKEEGYADDEEGVYKEDSK